MFSAIIERFAARVPATVMIHVLLERFLHPETIDEWFEEVAEEQYTRKLLFSTVLGLMLDVVLKQQPSLHAAYKNHGDVPVSTTALYDKVNNLEVTTSRALVNYAAAQASALVAELQPQLPSVLDGYRVKILDGNCLKASQHRLKATRQLAAAPLPGKSLAVYDPQLGVILDIVPCEDGHAQERSLLAEIINQVAANDVWIADRNFCVTHFLQSIDTHQGYFIIRHHANMSLKALSKLVPAGRCTGGTLFEQSVEVSDAAGQTLQMRRIVLKLTEPTTDGDWELVLLSNLPPAVSAAQIAGLYRGRWDIEGAFQRLEAYFDSEIETLCYPKAALFSFAVAVVAFNIYAVVVAALQAVNPETSIQEEFSQYYLAVEIANSHAGLLIAAEDDEFDFIQHVTLVEMAEILRYLARKVSLKRFKKHKRGPKKAKTPRSYSPKQPHLSTFKLLNPAS